MSFAALSEYVEGKRVALVGGAPQADEVSALQTGIICGVHNHARALDPQIIIAGFEEPEFGARTKWCFVNLGYDRSTDVERLCNENEVMPFHYDSRTYKGAHPIHPTFEWHNAFSKELNALPFTGISAMKLLLMMPIAELFVTGFTFYADDEGRFPYRVNAHFVEPQVEWFRRTVETDARVTLDSTLRLLFPPRVKTHTECVRCRTDEFGRLWRV